MGHWVRKGDVQRLPKALHLPPRLHGGAQLTVVRAWLTIHFTQYCPLRRALRAVNRPGLCRVVVRVGCLWSRPVGGPSMEREGQEVGAGGPLGGLKKALPFIWGAAESLGAGGGCSHNIRSAF